MEAGNTFIVGKYSNVGGSAERLIVESMTHVVYCGSTLSQAMLTYSFG
jgi:hypothetical protein